MKIGIISAMEEENSSIHTLLQDKKEHLFAGRTYYEGILFGVEVVAVFSHIGKVAAALTTTYLIATFHVDLLIFTGVAGALAREVKIGDVVVASSLVQHDMDASPLFPPFEVPLTGRAHFCSSTSLVKLAARAASAFLKEKGGRVHVGCVATGDQFFSSRERVEALLKRLPKALAVEMEGAAVAQVAESCSVPYLIIRTISDSADKEAPIDFERFISTVSSPYAIGILRELLDKCKTLSIEKPFIT